jgi:predicted DNA-binding protein YlxM (UPF0122 family)
MLKKFLISIILPILVCGILIAKPVEAKGFGFLGWGFGKINLEDWTEKMKKIFEGWADLLQISVDKVKNYWAEGKSLKEIMEAENISEEDLQKRMKEKRLEELKNQLQKLVEKGIITQEQADKRFEVMKKKLESQEGERMFRGRWKGFRRGWFGF